MSTVGAIKNLLYLFQKPTQTNSDIHEDFTAMAEVIEKYGGAGSLTYFPNIYQEQADRGCAAGTIFLVAGGVGVLV
jgi:hypothetical protein